MKQEKEELAVLFPFNEMELAGEKINLRPFVFGKWIEVITKATDIVSIVLDAVREQGPEVLDVSLDKENFRVPPQAFNLFIRLIDEGSNNLYDILAISARKTPEWVRDLEGEDGFKLLVGTYLVNKDFFSKQVAPLFPKLTESKDEKTTAKVSPGVKSPKN